jgi:hypothetical protein
MQDVGAHFGSAKPKRRRGRPHLDLTKHRERYWWALAQAHIDIGKERALPEFNIAEMLVTFRFAKLQNPEAWRDGSLLEFRLYGWMQGKKREELAEAMFRGDRKRGAAHLRGDALEHRDSTAYRPMADNLVRPLRKIRSLPVNDPNRVWLAWMTRAWKICLNGEVEQAPRAARFAANAGELDYFNAIMRPVMILRSQQGVDHAEWLAKNIQSLI